MKSIFQKLKLLLYTFLAGFLRIFGLANPVPNSSIGQLTGQNVSPTSDTVQNQNQKKAPSNMKVQNQHQAVRRDGDGNLVVVKPAPPVWKPSKQNRNKKTNLNHIKSKHRRKRIRSKRTRS